MNNYSDVTTAVTGGLRHAQSGVVMFGLRSATPQSWLRTRNAATLAAVRNASPAIAGVMATAKQAPQSRGSSAHT